MAKTDMLEEEFLSELRALRNEWHLTATKQIRTYQRIEGWLREVCPLCAVANKIHGGTLAVQALRAAWTIRMPADVAAEILAAADTLQGYDKTIRTRLLRACGLASTNVRF